MGVRGAGACFLWWVAGVAQRLWPRCLSSKRRCAARPACTHARAPSHLPAHPASQPLPHDAFTPTPPTAAAAASWARSWADTSSIAELSWAILSARSWEDGEWGRIQGGRGWLEAVVGQGPGGSLPAARTALARPTTPFLALHLLGLLGRALLLLEEAGQLEPLVLGQQGGRDLEGAGWVWAAAGRARARGGTSAAPAPHAPPPRLGCEQEAPGPKHDSTEDKARHESAAVPALGATEFGGGPGVGVRQRADGGGGARGGWRMPAPPSRRRWRLPTLPHPRPLQPNPPLDPTPRPRRTARRRRTYAHGAPAAGRERPGMARPAGGCARRRGAGLREGVEKVGGR